MGPSIKLGKVFGIPIGINYSWVVVFLLFIYLMAQQLEGTFPLPLKWLIAVVTAVLVFVSVLAHELSHSLVAVHRGIPVHGITLFIFGGVSQLAHEARRPLTEFTVAIVGPLTSVVIALVLGLLWLTVHDSNRSLDAIFFSLFAINLGLGIFNMLPGFPLDGGRVLRSAIWGYTGSYWKATQIATWSGQTIGGALVLIGSVWALGSGEFQPIWLSLIGGFLFVAATANFRRERLRESLRAYRVADIMTTNWYTLPGETPLASPLVAQGFNGGDDFICVTLGGRMQGIVTRRQMVQATKGGWSYTTLVQIMCPLSSVTTVEPAEPVYDAGERMQAEDLDRLAVSSNGTLLGFITRADAHRFVRSRQTSRLRA